MIHPIILCGGSGTRLWPASRESTPKQFIRLLGEESSFQSTAKRLLSSEGFSRPIVVTAAESRFMVAEQLLEVGVEADILLEPLRRDSAAAVAAATCYLAQRDPQSLLMVMPADHAVSDPAAFLIACREAAVAARDGLIMTLGVKPTFASTGYGYISPGDAVGGSGVRKVEEFVEKPAYEAAREYIDRGYLWNSGYFLFRADVMLQELERFAPDIVQAAGEAVSEAAADLDFIRLGAKGFSRSPQTSIDFAVMQQTALAGVLPVEFSWSDIGTWDAVWEVSPRNEEGNYLRGKVQAMDLRNSLVHSDGALTAVVGLEDVVVVSTPDAVLVTSRQHSGLVKDLVSELKSQGHLEASEHLRTYRPWGWYQRIDKGERFQVKRIVVKPGGRLSLQRHFHRAEHWVVVRGTAEVTIDDVVHLRHENEAAYIPIGAMHRLANPGRIPLELIEIQVGSYTGEDDIVRVEDVYGR